MLAVLLAQHIFCAFSVLCLCIKVPWNPVLKVTRDIRSIAGFYCFISHSTFRLLLLLVISIYYFYNAQALQELKYAVIILIKNISSLK